jgi:carboxymethylenebutenolidase
MALRNYLVGEVAEDLRDGLLNRREALRGWACLASASAVQPPYWPLAATAAVNSRGGWHSSCRRHQRRLRATASTNLGNPYASPALPVSCREPGRGERPKGVLLVIHENRGLTPHFVDLVGRLRDASYSALCVDLLSSQGGTGHCRIQRPHRPLWQTPRLSSWLQTSGPGSMSSRSGSEREDRRGRILLRRWHDLEPAASR